MTYTQKKDFRKTWDLPPLNESPLDLMGNDDDQDIYISERSSVVSSNDLSGTVTPIGKRLPTPTTSTFESVQQISRHSQTEVPDNPTPVLTQDQQRPKEEKKTKKNDLRKTPAGHVNVTSIPENKSSDYGENYYPYWYYYKSQNPAWMTRRRQNASHETPDPPQPHPHQPAFTSSSMKPQQQQPTPARKPRQHHHGSIAQSNQEKHRFEPVENNSSTSAHSITHDNHEMNHSKQRSSPKHPDEHRILPTKKPVIQQQRRKTKIDHDSVDNHGQSMSNNHRSSQDSSTLTITSNSMANRQKNRSKLSDKSLLVTDLDDPNKSRYHQNYLRSHNSPSIPSHQTHHHNPPHVRRRPPSGSEVHVVDVACRRPDRTSYLQQIRDPYHSRVSPISNQTLHLPLIINDHHQPKTNSPRFPTEYYGTLARQTHGKNWDESLDAPRIYKPDPQTRFYDRYLHSIVDKRLAA